MENSISQKFTFTSLIKFTIPSIVMMMFMSLYTIVDGVFVSRFVGTDALSSVNIVYPFINVVIAFGVMLGSGSSAVIAKKLGEGKDKEAKENFTLIILVGFILGIIIALIGYLFSDNILKILGTNDKLYMYCVDYFKASLIFVPAFIISLCFNFLAITAGKPDIGLILTLMGGFANIILDYVFIVPLDMGIKGAALATGMGVLIPSVIGIIYFIPKRGSLHFVKPKFDIEAIIKSCSNGSSEMVTNLSSGVTTMLFNLVMMKHLGSDGVAAITIVLYGQFLINSAYIGFSSGVAPVISYNYGNDDKEGLRNIIKYSFIFISISSIILVIVALFGAKNIVGVFADKGSNVYEIGYVGFTLFSTCFLFTGINIFTSAKFTAFSNGRVSATISFLRTFVFTASGIIILPKIIGINGVWLAVTVAEILTIIISLYFVNKYKTIYGYSNKCLNTEPSLVGLRKKI